MLTGFMGGVFGNMLAGGAASAAQRGARYLGRADWRRGTLGAAAYAIPPRLPAPNPSLNIGTAAQRRVRRAAVLARRGRHPFYGR